MIELSNDARYIDSILCETNCLSVMQIHRLLKLSDTNAQPSYAEVIAKRLCYTGRAVMRDNDVLVPMYIDIPEPDPEMLADVDIMLDLLRELPAAVSAKKPPYKLVFQARRDESAYAVAIVKGGQKYAFTSFSEQAFTVVFLLEDLSQADLIETSGPHYFAVFEENKLRYYKGG